MKERRVLWGALIALFIAFFAGVYAGSGGGFSFLANAANLTGTFSLGGSDSRVPSDVDAQKLWRAWNLLEQNYIETTASSTTPTPEERLWGAIKGLTQSYNDPYTVFLPPAEAKIFEEEISGAFEGVGMELGLRDSSVVVIAPLKGSPAERAGIKSGDVIVAVDGDLTTDYTIEDAVKKIRGKKGTTVVITIEREGVENLLKIPVVRDTISIPVAVTEQTVDGVFVIELYSFAANSSDLFRRALREFIESGSNKLLLDLRGNPGGYLEASVDMASYFLPVGEVVVVEDFKGNQNNIVHRSVGYNVFANRDIDMAILVNQGSASASEILAGALKEHDVAVLIGTRTFGKGSVQELLDIGGGAELKVTIARWLTPGGTSISDGGLQPDIEVERTREDIEAGRDPQRDTALQWLRAQ